MFWLKFGPHEEASQEKKSRNPADEMVSPGADGLIWLHTTNAWLDLRSLKSNQFLGNIM